MSQLNRRTCSVFPHLSGGESSERQFACQILPSSSCGSARVTSSRKLFLFSLFDNIVDDDDESGCDIVQLTATLRRPNDAYHHTRLSYRQWYISVLLRVGSSISDVRYLAYCAVTLLSISFRMHHHDHHRKQHQKWCDANRLPGRLQLGQNARQKHVDNQYRLSMPTTIVRKLLCTMLKAVKQYTMILLVS